MQRTPTPRSAVALVMAMFALVICAGLAVTMIDRSTSGVTMQGIREQRDLIHFSAASTANWAAQWCLTNPTAMPAFTGENATLQVPSLLAYSFTNAGNRPNSSSPTFTLTGLRTNADGSRLYRLTTGITSGTLGTRTYTTCSQEFLLKLTPAPPAVSTYADLFTRAMFADLGFTIQGSADTDAWNGSVGAYNNPKNGGGNVINNYGSALVGSNGTVTTQGNGWSINSNPKFQGNLGLELPPYTWTAPTSFTNQPAAANTSAAWTGSITLQAGQTYYAPGGINGATLTINVPASITKKADAVCTIYLGGAFAAAPFVFTGTNAAWAQVVMFQKDLSSTLTDISWNGNETAGVLSDPTRFLFVTEYGKNKIANITMNGTASFGGVLYAPYASVKLNGTFDFYGSLMIRSISELNGSFGMHYDTRLTGMTLQLPNATASLPTMSILGWRER